MTMPSSHPVRRLTRVIPEETLVGYHLCYGTYPTWSMYEARDMELLHRDVVKALRSPMRPRG
jgi:hypothetical protein